MAHGLREVTVFWVYYPSYHLHYGIDFLYNFEYRNS